MIKIKINNERYCEPSQKENVYKGDNNISNFRIELPQTFGLFPREECTITMNCYLPEGGRLSYNINTDKSFALQPITNDITEKEQKININFVIKHGDNVIGTTNLIELNVLDAPDNSDEPLTPRAEFDEKIKEQRETIAAQRLTIEEQTEQIAQDSKTIGSLNIQVGELTENNQRLENQHEIDLAAIKALSERVPDMETPPPVTPTGETQVIRPSEDYAGLASVTVDRVTAAADSDIQPENIKEGVEILGVEGSYNPFPEQSYGGIYITKKNALGKIAGLKIINLDGEGTKNLLLSSPFLISNTDIDALEEVEMINCKNFVSCFKLSNCENLKKVIFGGIKNLPGYCFGSRPTYFLESLTFSEGTESFGENFFYSRGSQVTEIILPKSCKKLYEQCFGSAPTLKRLYIGNKLEQIHTSAFKYDYGLEFVTIEPGFNCNNLNLSSSTLYSVETIVSWLEALADRTGETAYTLTMGPTNLNKLTDEQKAIAIGKNWNLA